MFDGPFDQLVEHRADDQRIQIVPDQDIGAGLAGNRVLDHADRVIRAGLDPVVYIAPEPQDLVAARAGRLAFDGGKRRVLDQDSAALNRRDQPVVALLVPPDHRGEELDQGLSADRAAPVVPSAVARDADVEVAAGRQPLRPGLLVRRSGSTYLLVIAGGLYLLYIAG